MVALFLFVCLCAGTKAKMESESSQHKDSQDDNSSNIIHQLAQTVAILQTQLEKQAERQAETTAELRALKKSHASLGNELYALKKTYILLENELKQSKNIQPEKILTHKKSLSHTHQQNESSSSMIPPGLTKDEIEWKKIECYSSVETELRKQCTSLKNEFVAIKDRLIANGSQDSLKEMNEKVQHSGEKVANLQSEVYSNTSSVVHTDVTGTHLKSDKTQIQPAGSSPGNLRDTLPASNKTFEAAPQYNSHRRLPIVAGAVMTFLKTLYNVGDCFSNKTGYFTAPTPGTYLFWVTGVFTGSRTLAINILRNGEILGSSFGVSPYFEDGVSRGIIVCRLDDGDKVHFSPDQNAILIGAATSYGGALLHPR